MVMPLCVCLGSGQWWWYHSLTPVRKCATADRTSCVLSLDACLGRSNVDRNSSLSKYCAVHKYVWCYQTLCNELCHVVCNALKCSQLSVSPFHIHTCEFHKDSICTWCPLALNDLKLPWSVRIHYSVASQICIWLGISGMMLWTTRSVGEISQARCHFFRVVDFLITLACL